MIKDLKESDLDELPKAALIIPSVPDLNMMKAIIQTCVLSREDVKTIIVSDEEVSMDVTDWLKEQKDIKLVSVKGLTPGAAFNKACEQAEEQEDLLALGKGSVLLPTHCSSCVCLFIRMNPLVQLMELPTGCFWTDRFYHSH